MNIFVKIMNKIENIFELFAIRKRTNSYTYTFVYIIFCIYYLINELYLTSYASENNNKSTIDRYIHTYTYHHMISG